MKDIIHTPFLKKQCAECHLQKKKDKKDNPSESDQEKETPSEKKPVITWLHSSQYPAKEHTFLLETKKLGEKLFIEAKALGKAPMLRAFTLPAIDSIKKIENDKTPPKIKEAKVQEVSQGVLINAAISWKTDEKANSSVRYGKDGHYQTISASKKFLTEHEVILHGLKSKSEYEVKITCNDIFGNSATSAPFSFSTAEFFNHQQQGEKNGKRKKKIKIKSSISQINKEQLLLELTANQPLSISVGKDQTEEPVERQIMVKMSDSDSKETKHIALQNKKYTSMVVCKTCHTDYNESNSHPVNILPSGDTEVPPDFPTLPDGRISCMSCHSTHASNIEFRLIKASRKELCLGCHPKKFY